MLTRRPHTHRTVVVLLATCGFATALAQGGPPRAPTRPVTDTYFGTSITDPYRWMEDVENPEVTTWMKGQADHARRVLDGLPLRAGIGRRIDALTNAVVDVTNVTRVSDQYFYRKRSPGEPSPRLFVRGVVAGAERLLVDPSSLAANGPTQTVTQYSVSMDGRYVSYLASAGGSETGELRVVDVATGRDMGERIDRVRFDSGQWLPDGRSFLYNRLSPVEPGAPAAERFKASRVYLHKLGTDPATDRAVLGFDVDPRRRFDRALLPFAWALPGTSIVLGALGNGVSRDTEFYVAPVSSLAEQAIPWRKLTSFGDEIGLLDVHDGVLYALTHKGAPRWKIVRTSLDQPDFARAQVVMPEGNGVITDMVMASDAVYARTFEAGIGRVWRVPHTDGVAAEVTLPFESSAAIASSNGRLPGVLIETTAWTQSRRILTVDGTGPTAVDTGLQPPSAVDASNVEVSRAMVPSHDGVLVPLTILHARDLVRDGRRPTLIDGYGAYGISREPTFTPEWLAWLERGGVIAVAHVRGGGEYGEDWHRGGYKATKPNTWKDFIACAEYLVAEKYTSAAHLAAEGASAGGVLAANVLVERPDLFAAVVIRVGVTNPLRAETTANGVPNIPEFGSVTTQDGFRALLGMDGYTKVKDGTPFPAVLLTTGINDTRVDPWMSAKMAARLQAATSSRKPVLLRIDYDAGHGLDATRVQRNELRADVFAFLLANLAP